MAPLNSSTTPTHGPNNKDFTTEFISKSKYSSPNNTAPKYTVDSTQQDISKSTANITPPACLNSISKHHAKHTSTPSTSNRHDFSQVTTTSTTEQLPIFNFDSSDNDSDTLEEIYHATTTIETLDEKIEQ